MNQAVRNGMLVFAALALAGCELLHRQGREGDNGRRTMMLADAVPLVHHEPAYAERGPMPVPVEPSPFELKDAARPAAMLSDIQAPKSPTENISTKPQPIPEEPIP